MTYVAGVVLAHEVGAEESRIDRDRSTKGRTDVAPRPDLLAVRARPLGAVKYVQTRKT